MNRRFGGFTEQQMEAIARKNLGFDGPMDQLNTFLAASPDKAAKLHRLTQKAMDAVGGGEGYASGGKVIVNSTSSAKKKTNSTGTVKSVTNPYPSNAAVTTTALNTPEKLVTPTEVTPMTVKPGEIVNPNTAKLPADPMAHASQVGTAATAAAPVATQANTYDAATTGQNIEGALDQTQNVHGTVSTQGQAEAATALPSADATVQGQMEKLMTQFEDGNIPAWAAGAKRNADAIMMGRGLGASSMAASATTQALMESALGIAVQDAQTFSAFEMQNLNNRQQARLQNAQAFLQMDLLNTQGDQAVEMFKSQARIQSMFTDQAAINAASQFNATSENQTEQFFASLKTQVAQFNAAQKNAVKMSDVEQKNAVEMFNKNMIDQRDQFEATNRLIIDQANAKWRQTVNTQDNANRNEANRQDALAATGLTEAAMNNLWQRERDIMAYAFTSAENASQRSHEVVLQKSAGKEAGKSALYEAAGSFVSQMIRGIF